MRRSLLVLLAVCVSPAALLHPPRPLLAPSSDVPLPRPSGPSPDPAGPAQALPDSALAELEAGRPWHATRVLRSELARGERSPERVLLLARAEAAHRSWADVRELLAGASWLDGVGGGEGWMLLGRALEEAGSWTEAEEAYARYLAGTHAGSSARAPAVRARRARALARAGAWPPALALLEELGGSHPTLAAWSALDLAGAAAEEGDPSTVRRLLASVQAPGVRARGWDLEPRALLVAGDSAGAAALLEETLPTLEGDQRRASGWALLGELRRARGDDAGARTAYREALDLAPSAGPGFAAARALVEMGGLDAAGALSAARALERAGDVARAVRAYDLHRELAGGELPADVRLSRARLLARSSGREAEAVEELTALSAAGPEVGPGALAAWRDLRTRQGRTGDAQTLRDRIVERYPGSGEAAEIVFLRGDLAQDAGRLEEASRHYRWIMEANPSHDRAGLSAMRLAQMHLARGAHAEAARVFDAYLAAFPTGQRWDEASYWSARAHQALGDQARAEVLLADIGERDPFGYYAVLASELRGEPYTVDLPAGEEPPFPDWLEAGVRDVELLQAAGLEAGATATLDDLATRARATPAVALRLAEEMIRLDRPLVAINLAFELRRGGTAWTRRLLEAAYPFPRREAVLREGREWGVDPLLVAAVIRQESAWAPTVVSSAGAGGLMQVLPETGAGLARNVGPEDFGPELLRAPDVNLHLGTVYLRDLLRRYPELPLLLSAYNAGPHRAARWKDFPEAGDMLRFTERIPFRETRDYVKRVTRNLALYGALYGP